MGVTKVLQALFAGNVWLLVRLVWSQILGQGRFWLSRCAPLFLGLRTCYGWNVIQGASDLRFVNVNRLFFWFHVNFLARERNLFDLSFRIVLSFYQLVQPHSMFLERALQFYVDRVLILYMNYLLPHRVSFNALIPSQFQLRFQSFENWGSLTLLWWLTELLLVKGLRGLACSTVSLDLQIFCRGLRW